MSKDNQDIVIAIYALARSVDRRSFSKTLDTNGWQVLNYGAFTTYSKLVGSNTIAVPAGDSDQNLVFSIPTGLVSSQLPAVGNMEVSLNGNWTSVDWNYLIRAFSFASYPTTTTAQLNYHVYVSSARNISAWFLIRFTI